MKIKTTLKLERKREGEEYKQIKSLQDITKKKRGKENGKYENKRHQQEMSLSLIVLIAIIYFIFLGIFVLLFNDLSMHCFYFCFLTVKHNICIVQFFSFLNCTMHPLKPAFRGR